MVDERTGSAVRNLLASASIFSTAVDEVMAGRLEAVARGRITFAQLKVLTLVAHTTGIGVSEVATFLGVSPAAASKALARLVDAGLLSRTASPDDRRMQRLSVTVEGRRLLDAYEEEADEALDRLFGHLDPVGLRRLASSLDRLSLTVAERGDGAVDEACFRCGIYFRDRCLLRGASGNRTCYQHLGGEAEVAPAAV